MGSAEFGVKFVTNGFKPSEISPAKMWKRLQEDFVNMYNDYCEVTNAAIDELNKNWTAAHPETEEDDSKELSAEEAEIRDLKAEKESYEYGCYLRDAFDMGAYMVNLKHEDSYLSGFVFMDGPTPVFGARIKEHPELSMHFVIEK